jgi:hypothetical protein
LLHGIHLTGCMAREKSYPNRPRLPVLQSEQFREKVPRQI